MYQTRRFQSADLSLAIRAEFQFAGEANLVVPRLQSTVYALEN